MNEVATPVTSKAVAAKLISDRRLGKRGTWDSDVVQRETDYRYEVIQRMPDPTLTQEDKDDLGRRKLAIPLKWVTVAVYDPYVIDGVARALQ